MRVLPDQSLNCDHEEIPESCYKGIVTVQVVLDADTILDIEDVAV